MGYENGKIELHEMNEEYAFKTVSDFEQELKKFLFYVDILWLFIVIKNNYYIYLYIYLLWREI